MLPSDQHKRAMSSVNRGHLRSVICGQPTSVLTPALLVFESQPLPDGFRRPRRARVVAGPSRRSHGYDADSVLRSWHPDCSRHQPITSGARRPVFCLIWATIGLSCCWSLAIAVTGCVAMIWLAASNAACALYPCTKPSAVFMIRLSGSVKLRGAPVPRDVWRVYGWAASSGLCILPLSSR